MTKADVEHPITVRAQKMNDFNNVITYVRISKSKLQNIIYRGLGNFNVNY